MILTPNPKAAEPRTGVDVIWGKEIVFRNVPVTRQDAGRYTALPPRRIGIY